MNFEEQQGGQSGQKKGIWNAAKHYFVRTPENGGSPHLLKTNLLIVFVGLMILTQVSLLTGLVSRAVAYLPNFDNMLASVLPAVLSMQTNDYRHENQVNALKESPLLDQAAQLKANDMAQKGYFSHIGPNNEKPWVWMQKVGYGYSYAGENLAINFVDSSDVTRAWINSPAHKQNLINSKFTETGIGTAEGAYEGKQTTFVVQFFASPAGSSPQSPIVTELAVADKATSPKPEKANNTQPKAALATAAKAASSSSTTSSTSIKVASVTTPAASGTASAGTSTSTELAAESSSATSSSLTESSTSTASSSELADASNPSAPEVLGLYSDNSSIAPAQGAAQPPQGAFEKMLASLFVHPKDAAKHILFGAMILISLLLVISISHSAAFPMSRAAASASAGLLSTSSSGRSSFISRISHSLFAHKKPAFEVACVLLVMLSVWSLGKTAEPDTAETPAPIGATSDSV